MWYVDKTCLGYAGSVQEETLGLNKYTHIETKNPLYVTILLKVPDKQSRTQTKVSYIFFFSSVKDSLLLNFLTWTSVFRIRIRSDPYHLAGSALGNVDLDPGTKKKLW